MRNPAPSSADWTAAVRAGALLAVCLAAGTACRAAQAGPVDASGGISYVDLVLESGPLGFLIIGLGCLLLYLTVEIHFSFSPRRLVPDRVLVEIEQALDEADYDRAMKICDAEDSFITRILGAGLTKVAIGLSRVEEAMGEETEAQATLLQHRLSLLKLLARLSVALGFAGTVVGMVVSFKRVANNPLATAQDLADGLYHALGTTFLGILVGIAGMVVYTLLRNRTMRIVMDARIVCGEMLDRFRFESSS